MGTGGIKMNLYLYVRYAKRFFRRMLFEFAILFLPFFFLFYFIYILRFFFFVYIWSLPNSHRKNPHSLFANGYKKKRKKVGKNGRGEQKKRKELECSAKREREREGKEEVRLVSLVADFIWTTFKRCKCVTLSAL